MRKWIDIVSESPISNVEILGNVGVEGSFQQDDLKAISSPKWQAKLEKRFENTIYPINLYFLNVKDREMPNSINPDNYISGVTSHIREWDYHVSGYYEPADFNQNFGFIPEEYQDRINVMMTHNYGDERIPLTPWIVAHRMMHAFINTNHHYTRNHMPDGFKKYWDGMSLIMQVMLFNTELWKEDIKEIYRKVANFRSAREGKILRNGEFYMELATQLFLTGDFVFDLSNLSIAEDKKTKIENLVNRAKDDLRSGFAEVVGKLVVL